MTLTWVKVLKLVHRDAFASPATVA